MDRRSALKNVLFISAGTVLLPACAQDKPSIQLTNLSITGSQEKMIEALASAIIPSGNNFIGAADVKAHQFALMMVDDCEPPDTQKKFMEGMKSFDQLVSKKYDGTFNKISDVQKKELLLMFDNKKETPADAQLFYGITKMYTIQAFTSSEKYLTNIRKFKLVPGGNFKGCVPVAKS